MKGLLIKIRYLIHYLFVIPHLLVYKRLNSESKTLINEDLSEMNRRYKTNDSLAYYLINHAPYRNLYYYRVGKHASLLKVFLHPYPYLAIGSKIEYIGGGAFVLNHPMTTFINCKRIGDHFTICQSTTIGNGLHGRNDLIPTIGNNVSLGANVNIIGNISIGNNVIIGAGSVVVKDVPDNCVVAGNPAKIIRYLTVD